MQLSPSCSFKKRLLSSVAGINFVPTIAPQRWPSSWLPDPSEWLVGTNSSVVDRQRAQGVSVYFLIPDEGTPPRRDEILSGLAQLVAPEALVVSEDERRAFE